MRFLYLLFACAIVLGSCNNTTNKTTSVDDSLNKSAPAAEKLPTSALNDAGTQTLLAVVNKYYDVKNALITTKATRVDSAAQQLIIAADSLRSTLQNDKAHQSVVPYADTVVMTAQAITAIKNATCEQQQVPFSKLSDAFFTLLQNVQLKNAHVYRQHCPMAFDEKGAYWLSNEEDIKNPYFPKRMLECGDVADSLK